MALVKVRISPQAEKDIIRQFRYYLVDQDAPLIALRYRQAVMDTINGLPESPRIGKPVEGSMPGLRSWPVQDFEAIRIYYREVAGGLQVVRLFMGSET